MVTLYTIDVTDTSTVRRSMVNIRNDQGLIATSNTARARVALMSDITGLHGNIVQEIRRGLRPSVPFFATYTTMRGTGTGTAVPSAYMCSDWLEVPMALPSPNAVYEFLLAQDAAVEHCRESAARTARTARIAHIAHIARTCGGDFRHALHILQNNSSYKDTVDDAHDVVSALLAGTYAGSLQDLERAYTASGSSIGAQLHRHYPNPDVSHLTSIEDVADIADGFSAAQLVSKYHRTHKMAELAAWTIAATAQRINRSNRST